MKHRLTYLAAILVIVVFIGGSLLQPIRVSAATASGNDTCTIFPSTCAFPTPGNPTGKINITKACPSSMSGFPDPAGNLNAFPTVASTFFQCETRWAKANVGSYVPNTYLASADPNNTGVVDYCHRNFTGDYLKSCQKGFAKNGKGTASTACGSNAACLVGFTAGGDPNQNPSLATNQNKNGAGDTAPTCESSGGPLSWILCPVFNMLSDASQWIFQNIVQPFLITPPVSTDPNDPSFQIWSNLRIYGDIFLVIALLVIVFGESVGGGLIDAYTAKKVLPRLLVAAILINLSIYIVAILVDLSNIVGQGLGSILTAPLTHCKSGGGNCWDFNLSLGDQARVFGVGLIGLIAGGTAVAGFLGTIIFGGFAGVSAVITVAFFVLLPVFFGILAVFITLIVRKGLILMLVLVSPVAFALYCLPNTQQYFRRWWDLLIEALMVYPIIVAIFGVSEILSVTILAANSISPGDLQGGNVGTFFAGNLNRTLSLVVAFLLQFLPLLAIPFAFRFSSGLLGRAYDLSRNAGERINKLADTRREHAKRDYQAGAIASRSRIYHGMQDLGQRHQGPLGIGRRTSRFIGRTAGGYNIEALASAGRAEKAKELNDQIATGRDEEIRGLTVNKQWALSSGAEGEDWRTRSDGTREFKTLGGAWIAEQDVDAGHRRWGTDQFAQQAALSYEMRKGITEEDADRIATNYQHVATGPGGWGMSQGEAGGAFKGAAFENQNQHVEYKYTHATGDRAGQLSDAHSFVDEIYNNRGSYNLAQMNSRTIEQLKTAHTDAVVRGDVDQQEKIAAIAETFMHDSSMGGGRIIPGSEGGVQEYQEGVPEGTPGRRIASTPGSAHTAERVRELASMTGVYGAGPTGPYTDPNHAPSPNDRQQS